MKNILKIFCILAFIPLLCGCDKKAANIANPWIECGNNTDMASEVAGFKFPVILSDLNVTAMDGMIQVKYPLNESKNVTVRKSIKAKDDEDISGDYNSYPINKKIELFDSVYVDIKAKEDKIYTANILTESGHYSVSCEKGLTLDELREVFKVIEKAETHYIN